jgi:uncharacterized protein (TIGR02145 family)
MRNSTIGLLYIASLLILTLFCSQCSLFESLTPDEPDSVEATIGQEGGSIEMNAVKIEIPEGAFSQPFTLSIEALEEQVIPAEDQASKLFQIKGLPVNFGQSIRFSIEPDDQGATGLFGVIGEKVYVPSLGNESIRYSFREGSLSNGAFSFQLEATNQNSENSSETADITIGLVKDYHLVTLDEKDNTADKSASPIRFGAICKPKHDQQVLAILPYFRHAYEYVKDELGFDLSGRTKWPVIINVVWFQNGAYGYFEPSKFGDNYGEISINQDSLGSIEQMRVTIGHEFFHMAQSLYDPRWAYTKATSAGPWLWMDEASATWIEEKFSDDPNYASIIRAAFLKAPLNGLIEGAATGAQDHGYGMSSFIKYITKNHGKEKVKLLYEQCKAENNNLLNAINTVLQAEHNFYYPDFIKQYATGQLYNDFTHQNFVHDDFFVVNNANDTLKEFEKNFASLSSKIYRIKINDAGIDPESYLTFKSFITAPNTNILALKTQAGVTSLLGESLYEIQIQNLKQLQQENATLWLFLVNYQNQPLTAVRHGIRIHHPEQSDCPPEGVQIGSQCWMKENLNITAGNSWCYDNEPYYCTLYGRLYDWQTALTACPEGWKLPSDADWQTLVDFAGTGGGNAGGRLKSTSYWEAPNTGANDQFGFSALPGGDASNNGGFFMSEGFVGKFWTATENETWNAWLYKMTSGSGNVERGWSNKNIGFSVRCIKD